MWPMTWGVVWNGWQSSEPVSVRSTGRQGRLWALTERLSEEQQQALADACIAGTPQKDLAEQYGISLRRLRRLLASMGVSVKDRVRAV
jgi:hypothetical protein